MKIKEIKAEEQCILWDSTRFYFSSTSQPWDSQQAQHVWQEFTPELERIKIILV